MDARLHEAALKGDVDSLTRLLEEDSFILNRAVNFSETPLHVAALFGHVEFAKEILSRNPGLASVLDSERSSPLHLASAKGHVDMVKELLKIDPNMCLVRDQDGRTPLHAAALKGRVKVVKELICAKRIATRVLTGRREPILHLCVNHNRFESVKSILECVENSEDDEFVKMKDDDDNTILHLAVSKKNIPLTKFLLQKTKMKAEVNALNVDGFTAFDVLMQNHRKSKDIKLEGILIGAGARRSKYMHCRTDDRTIQPLSRWKNRWKDHMDWLNETRSVLMVVAILISTITFQAEINPPGGVWQDDKMDAPTLLDPRNHPIRDVPRNHTAGESIMADKYPDVFIIFTVFNSIAFVASLIIIILLMSGFPLKRRIFMRTLIIITWLSVSSLLVTYGLAYYTVSTGQIWSTELVIRIALLAWVRLNCLAFALNFLEFITTIIYACI
ncbi:ankyrin repeat-containing protein BDA1-like [Magnolia sinica]|uniref:ankyrin repeat-containing protein BDA1-like n=1 Tax=Magnolia sinica TaxID=86752 RepID=UPI00265ADF59|nr:ankyrin repeat-containing protein BDA1-like [Magnolia sinica]